MAPPSARAVADSVLTKRIRTIHMTSHETYGVPRVHAELRAGGQKHGRKRIARLMRAAGIVGVSRRRGTVVTTRRDKDARPGIAFHALEEGQDLTITQPRLPICAQVSKSWAWPRTNTIPLIELEPPSNFPRGTGSRRPLVLASGSDE